jgi:hypothetical protein
MDRGSVVAPRSRALQVLDPVAGSGGAPAATITAAARPEQR